MKRYRTYSKFQCLEVKANYDPYESIGFDVDEFSDKKIEIMLYMNKFDGVKVYGNGYSMKDIRTTFKRAFYG